MAVVKKKRYSNLCVICIYIKIIYITFFLFLCTPNVSQEAVRKRKWNYTMTKNVVKLHIGTEVKYYLRYIDIFTRKKSENSMNSMYNMMIP